MFKNITRKQFVRNRRKSALKQHSDKRKSIFATRGLRRYNKERRLCNWKCGYCNSVLETRSLLYLHRKKCTTFLANPYIKLHWDKRRHDKMKPIMQRINNDMNKKKIVGRAAKKRMNRLWKTEEWINRYAIMKGFRTIRELARYLRSNETKPEKEIYKLIKEYCKFRVYRQRPFVCLRLITDFCVPRLKLCIYYDGEYWHKNKQAKDLRHTLDLMENGYKVIRIRERSREIGRASCRERV